MQHGTIDNNGVSNLQISINHIGSFGSKAHELKHAYQVKAGKLIPVIKGNSAEFNFEGNSNLPWEAEAYQRQYSVGGNLPKSNAGTVNKVKIAPPIKNINQITQRWVLGIYIGDPNNLDDYLYRLK